MAKLSLTQIEAVYLESLVREIAQRVHVGHGGLKELLLKLGAALVGKEGGEVELDEPEAWLCLASVDAWKRDGQEKLGLSCLVKLYTYLLSSGLSAPMSSEDLGRLWDIGKGGTGLVGA